MNEQQERIFDALAEAYGHALVNRNLDDARRIQPVLNALANDNFALAIFCAVMNDFPQDWVEDLSAAFGYKATIRLETALTLVISPCTQNVPREGTY